MHFQKIPGVGLTPLEIYSKSESAGHHGKIRTDPENNPFLVERFTADVSTSLINPISTVCCVLYMRLSEDLAPDLISSEFF